MPEFVKLIWELELGEIVVAGTIGVVVAVAGIVVLWKLINRRYNGLSQEHEWLDGSLKNMGTDLKGFMQNKSEKLENVCNDTNKRIYGFIKTQEAIRQTENQARETNIDLNQFMQSTNAMITQNSNFTIEKQNLENKIASMEKESYEKQQKWDSERQALEDKILRLKKELRIAQKQNKQSYDDGR